MSGELQRLRVDEIDVGGRDSENDTVGLRNVLGDEAACLLFNVCWLVANGNLQPLAPSRAASALAPTLVNPGKSTSVRLSTCGE